MIFEQEKTYRGKVIFRTDYFGFIEIDELEESVYFNNSVIDKNTSQPICFFDIVTCHISIIQSGIHAGKKIALSVSFIEHGVLTDYMRIIGELIFTSGKYGIIHSPQLDKPVKVYETRIIYGGRKLENNSLLVFNPVKYYHDSDYLFAFFAYPVEYEKNHQFLIEQYKANRIEKLRQYILNLNSKEVVLTPKELLRFEMLQHENDNSILKGIAMKKILSELKREYNFHPSYDEIKTFIDENTTLQMFMQGTTDHYNYNTLETYFINTFSDNKRYIIEKINPEDRKRLAKRYFEEIDIITGFRSITNDIKTFLDIFHRNKNTKDIEYYERARMALIQYNSFNEIIDLWENDYIHLDGSYLEQNLDLDNIQIIEKIINKKDNKFENILLEKYDRYIQKLEKETKGIINLEIYNHIYLLKNISHKAHDMFVKRLNNILSEKEKYILWLLDINIEINITEYINRNYENINAYYKLRTFLKDDNFLHLTNSITTKSLIESIQILDWEELTNATEIYPKERNECFHFLEDIRKYNLKHEGNSINLYEIANSLYEYLPKYTIHHLRIWLYDYLDDSYFSYTGFRTVFKQLNKNEQKVFRQRVNYKLQHDLHVTITNEVKPCVNFTKVSDSKYIYFAKIENIYFTEGTIKLRKEDRKYTESYPFIFSTIGFNQLPNSHELNSFVIELEVIENKIKEVNGFEVIYSKIFQNEIERSLGKVTRQTKNNSDTSNQSYAEDLILRKKIIDFLYEIQTEEFEVLILGEPKNFYRRLDETSGIDEFEKVGLFTIVTEGGFAIIWENIDYSLDRSTFVFKTKKENYDIQVEKIKIGIASYAQLRSTLIRRSNNDIKLANFKDNLGFVNSIKKRRGKEGAFESWKKNLMNAANKNIPPIPTDDKLDELENWSPEIFHLSKSGPKIKPIKISEIDINIRNIHEQGRNYANNGEMKTISIHYKKNIYKELKKLNEKISKYLK